MVNIKILLFLLCLNAAEGLRFRKPLSVIIDSYTYNFNLKFANGSVILRPENHVCHVTAGFVTYQDLKDVFASFTLQIKLPNNVKYQTMAKIMDLDFCGFMKGNIKENIIRVVYTEVKERINVTLACPVAANFYVLNDLIVDTTKITPLTMPGNYRLLINFDWKRKGKYDRLFDISIYGGLKAK